MDSWRVSHLRVPLSAVTHGNIFEIHRLHAVRVQLRKREVHDGLPGGTQWRAEACQHLVHTYRARLAAVEMGEKPAQFGFCHGDFGLFEGRFEVGHGEGSGAVRVRGLEGLVVDYG